MARSPSCEVCPEHSGVTRTLRMFLGVSTGALVLMVPLIASFLIYVAKLNTVVELAVYRLDQVEMKLKTHVAKERDGDF